MEAASLPRPHRRRAPSWKAQGAVLVYGLAVAAVFLLVTGPWERAAPAAAEATAAPTVTAPAAEALALDSVAARTARSILPVGDGVGFVAWTTRDATLLLTVGGDRGDVVPVTKDGLIHDGEIVRADPATGLALVRVADEVGRPLWQERRPVTVAPGDWLVAVAPGASTHLEAQTVRYAGIGVRGTLRPGSPVLGETGRLVGVAGPSGVVPIGRACGPIRRCG